MVWKIYDWNLPFTEMSTSAVWWRVFLPIELCLSCGTLLALHCYMFWVSEAWSPDMNPALFLQVNASLLDLPDLALEHIAANLSPPDLASCMMCCSTLRMLLRPRQSAMVCAQSLGKKWVLRALGRAIFADLAARYEAGNAGSDLSGTAQNWEACRAYGQHVAATGERQFRVSMLHKASMSLPAAQNPALRGLGWFFYLCLLAKSRGFATVLGRFQAVWERAALTLPTIHPGWVLDWPFQDLEVFESQILDFNPSETFASVNIFPDKAFFASLYQLGAAAHSHLELSISKASLDLLSAELMSTMWFVQFLHLIHLPLWRSFTGGVPIDGFAKAYGAVLDLKFKLH